MYMHIISCCHLTGGSGTKTNLVPGETQALSRAVIKEQWVFVNIASRSRASNLPVGFA